MAAVLTALPVQAKLRTVTETDTQGNVKRIIELQDTVIDGVLSTDTVSILTYESATGRQTGGVARSYNSWEYDFVNLDAMREIVPLAAVIAVFGTPLLIVLAVLIFRHWNRRAKYRLIEQALAAGQPLPQGFFEQAGVSDIRTKGIRNIFLGIGLCIFLWALTEQFSVASIGLLFFFTGCGQVVIYYAQWFDNLADRRRGKPGQQDDRAEQGNDDVQ